MSPPSLAAIRRIANSATRRPGDGNREQQRRHEAQWRSMIPSTKLTIDKHAERAVAGLLVGTDHPERRVAASDVVNACIPRVSS